ncbi:MAG: hypothetical protein KDI33_12535 [Halioglobus sp.]|nr:hypothetical protein [Halioglobus sp.]
MDSDLKKENSSALFLILATSLVVSALFQFDLKVVSGLMDAAVIGGSGVMLSAVLVMIANLIPHSIKHKLVFTRFKNELAGCRVDSLCRRDTRIDYELAQARWPNVFEEGIDPDTRNSRWYHQIYKPVRNEPSVLQAHRSFFLYRDAFSGLLLIFLATLSLSLFGKTLFHFTPNPMIFAVQGTLAVFALVAARISGSRFVVNAVAAAEQD